MKLYIAGPMRGYPHCNFPAFDAAAWFLRDLGHDAINPADHDREVHPGCELDPSYIAGDPDTEKYDFHELLGWDFQQIVECDGIVLLPGWENSVGAGHELYVARACKKHVFFLESGFGSEGEYVLALRPQVELPPFTLIGLMGYARSGKDTVASILVKHSNFQQMSFAEPLREMLYALDPLTYGPGQGRAHHDTPSLWSVREIVNELGWEKAKDDTDEYGVRGLLQRLGTDAGRNVLGQNIWVETAMRRLEPGRRYVFSDVRFPNEAQAIKDAGGKIALVWRPGYGPINGHASETALDGWCPDATIVNDGAPEDLIVPVRQLLDPAFAK